MKVRGETVKATGSASRENASPSPRKEGRRRKRTGEGNGAGSSAGCPGRAAPPGWAEAAAAVPPGSEGARAGSAVRGPR